MKAKIIGADVSVTNLNGAGTHWSDTKQALATHGRLFKVSFTNLKATDCYLWVFDLAAGTTSSAAPVMTRYCPGGLSDTWDFYTGGSLFTNGIYVAVATNAPTTPTTTPVAAGDDAMIVKLETREGW